MNYDRRMPTVMIRDVKPEVHKAFRIWCIENEISMNQKLNELLEQFVKTITPPEGGKK